MTYHISYNSQYYVQSLWPEHCSNSIHNQSKKFLKCLTICTMVKGSVVQILTCSFVLLTLMYALGVLQRLLGIFWWPSKGTGRNTHAPKQILPVCQGIFSPPPLLIHPGLCWPLQETHIWLTLTVSFFSLNHYWWQAHYEVSTGLAVSAVKGLY